MHISKIRGCHDTPGTHANAPSVKQPYLMIISQPCCFFDQHKDKIIQKSISKPCEVELFQLFEIET